MSDRIARVTAMIRGVTTQPDLTLLSDLWNDVRGTAEGVELEAELAREVSDGHALARTEATAIAARKLRKEVIFGLADGRWAWVHLTWHSERDPRWPSVVMADTWPQLVDELQDAARG